MAGPKPVVLSGPSGAGKSTLLKKLMKEFDNVFGFSVSRKCASIYLFIYFLRLLTDACSQTSGFIEGFQKMGLHEGLMLFRRANTEN